MENEKYKKEISEMLNEMENNKILKLIYNFVKSGYKEEKQGNYFSCFSKIKSYIMNFS